MLLTILSALFGGALRLAPEILKFLDTKNDRQHELDMQDKQLAFQNAQAANTLAQINAQGAIDVQKAKVELQTADLSTLQTAFTTQQQMAVASGGFALALNALVRPAVTFYVFVMWGLYHLASVIIGMHGAWGHIDTMAQAVIATWTDNDQQLLVMIASFYFVGRTLDKGNT